MPTIIEGGKSPVPTDLKFNEMSYLGEVEDYILKTYGQHYADNKKKVQAFESIVAAGNADGFAMGNIQKLSARYGKKDGFNRLDLLKIAHYAILMLYVHDYENRGLPSAK